MRKDQKLVYNWTMAVNDKETNRFKGFISVSITKKQLCPSTRDRKRMLNKIKRYGYKPTGEIFKR